MKRSDLDTIENTLRSQRAQWQEISERIAVIPSRDLSPEPPRRILLFGIGSSHFVARLTGFALIRDKTRSRMQVISCSSLGIGADVLPQKGDWCFGFSHSGDTRVTLQALEHCDRVGAFSVLVTAQGVTAPEFVRYVLPAGLKEDALTPTAAVTGAICAVTTLLLGAKCLEEWDAIRSIGEPDLDVMRRRAGQGPTVILGEWEGEWLAREGALKLKELAGVPVRAYGTEEYFHGPRQALGKDDVIWHISLPKDPRNTELKPAHSIGVFGTSPLAWVPALVELQWLALATAHNRAG